MESLNLCIGLLLLLAVGADSQICPVMEGRGITLNCTVVFSSKSLIKVFTWVKKVNTALVNTAAYCDLNLGCFPSTPASPYTFIMTKLNASRATSNMTIHSTARTDQGSWFCSGYQDVLACDLKVVATLTNVSCSQPELHNDNVQVTCTGDRVYPQPLCQFTCIKNSVEQLTYTVAVKNQTRSQSQNTDYFYPECAVTFPVHALGFGSHQFHVMIYPNVTGNTATDMRYGRNSSLTYPVEINRPEAVLESCPQGYIKEGTTASCTCREKNNKFIKANVSWSRSPGASVVVGKQTCTLTFTAQRNNPSYICGAEVFGIWSNKTFVPQVAYPPAITNFTVTGAVNKEVQANTNVMFYCEAEGNPSLSLTLLRDSDSQILAQTNSNNKAILQFNKNMSCQDSGIYVCKAQTLEDKGEETMEIYVFCKQQLGSMESQNKVYSIQVNQIFDVNIKVIGYPEPQLSLHSSPTDLRKNEYNLAYYTTTPGNGVINVKIHTVLEAYFQKYELNISNTQGSFIYSFEIKEENAEETGGLGSVGGSDVGAIVGKIIEGIVVIVLIALVVYIARRKGLINKCIKKKGSPVFEPSADYEENVLPITEYGASLSLNGSIMAGQAADLHYMNTDQPYSPYITIDDNQSVTTSPYEEVRTIPANSSTSVTTNMREDQPYSHYLELVDETPGTAGTRDYVN